MVVIPLQWASDFCTCNTTFVADVHPPPWMTTTSGHTFTAGKYLVTPFSRKSENGDFISVVSIRCGHGSTTRDKIYTFTHPFGSQEIAIRHAAVEGRKLLGIGFAAE